jgi:hypothetical protein
MKSPSLKGAFLVLVAGVASSLAWSFLFAISVVFLKPLLTFTTYQLHWSPIWVINIFWSVYSLVCASLFVYPLWLFMRRTLYVSAAIFITAFLAAIFVPLLLINVPMLLDSFFDVTPLWLFVFGFVFLVFMANRFTKERHA